MTRDQWESCTDPTPMLRFLIGTDERVQDLAAFPNCKVSHRKLRLFACACYWRVRHLLPDPRAQFGIEVAEDFADGRATAADLEESSRRLREPLEAMEERWRASRGEEQKMLTPIHGALALALVAMWREAPKAAYYASSNATWVYGTILNRRAIPEEQVQCDLLRCIFGGHFLSSTIPVGILAWNNGTLARIAQSIYEERGFGDLPVLADALEDAGCTNADIFAHCRQPGPHARGCWPVDLLLNKE